MPSDDWIKQTLEAKREMARKNEELAEKRIDEGRIYEAKVDSLWQDLVGELKRVSEEYNGHVGGDDTRRLQVSVDPGTRSIKVHKDHYPAGSLICSLNREEKAMEVRVVVKQSRASLQEWTDRVGIAVVGDGLVWTHGPELTKEMVARRVLEPLFRAI